MNPTPPSSRWKRMIFHPVFPLIIYVLLTQLVRDEYPFSHYPMYSKPNSESVGIQFLADGNGRPLPIMFHTGLSSSQVSKLMGNREKKFATHEEAGRDVLKYIRSVNAGRRGRELPSRIQLVETTIGFKDGVLVESRQVIAEDSQP
ncbi:MAG: hypothetical protein WCN98_09240 [Verrucomicrobiaceae bacterium]